MARVLRIYHVLLGAVLVCLGVWTFIDPEVLAYYELVLEDAEARIAVRAIIGGGEIGVGLILAFGVMIGISRNALYCLASSVFLSVGIARLGAILIEQGSVLGWQPWRESSVELLLGVFAVFAAIHSGASRL